MTPRRVVLAAVAIALVAGLAAGAWYLGVGRSAEPGPALGPPHFVEETARSGIEQTFDGPFAYFTGGGVAVLDCDDDGRPDLYVSGGANPAALYRNVSQTGAEIRFGHEIAPETDLTGVTGAYPLDIDGDGHLDLAVLRIGENVLLRGTGDCRFERANERWAFDGGNAPTMAFAATWEATNTLPTLAFGNYVNPDHAGVADLCVDNAFVRPAPDNTSYAAPIPLHPSWCTLSMLFSDWDGSGRRDLRVSNDQHFYVDGQEQLWRIEPGAAPREYTADDGWIRVNVEGMGIGSFDLTGDGLPEVYLTSQGENRLQTLTSGPAKPTYRDIGLRRGVLADKPFTGGDPLPSTAWHPEFDDVNDDGWMDLFVSKGNVKQEEDFAKKDPSNLLLGQADGTFIEAADRAGILDFDLGRGAALTDLNLDGLLDLVEVHLSSPVRVWRNLGGAASDAGPPAPMGHWLQVRVTQPGPNRDAIGGWLEVRFGGQILRRELTVGGGHGGDELGWVHVGLGPATDAEVRVRWPDGTAGDWQRLAADRFVRLDRATGATVWQPPAG